MLDAEGEKVLQLKRNQAKMSFLPVTLLRTKQLDSVVILSALF